MKITLCQLNPLVGDIKGNTDKIISIISENKNNRPDLFVFTELVIQGYPPKDLLEKKWFVKQSKEALHKIVDFSKTLPEIGVVLGTVLTSEKMSGKPLVNAAVLVCNGKVVFTQSKMLLPTYDVFDETRYFEPAESQDVYSFKDEKLGITICEDAWNVLDVNPLRPYDRNPVRELAHKGATIIINISASPFHYGKEKVRYDIMKNHAKYYHIPVVFVNQCGGNDDLIFDGNSMIIDGDGYLRKKLTSFFEDVSIVDTKQLSECISIKKISSVQSIYNALVCGVKDYVLKCGFSEVIIGLSGGIDSAVTAVIAQRAVGSENVWGVTMPSRYSSEGSINDSKKLADNLKIKYSCISIENVFSCLNDLLLPFFEDMKPDITEENMQARIRGIVLMSLSNKFGRILLSTGNKSEMAVGYSTLYGDMNGGLCVISDLPKGMVYNLAKYINKDKEIIPDATVVKSPSAELRLNQKDEDSLPPYPILDAILEMLIEQGYSVKEIISKGYDKATVEWVAKAVARNEYKRRQAPTGLKVTPKAFGSGRRFPIASGYDWDS